MGGAIQEKLVVAKWLIERVFSRLRKEMKQQESECRSVCKCDKIRKTEVTNRHLTPDNRKI